MGTPVVFFPHLNISCPKEKTFYKVIQATGKEDTSKESKSRTKEKRNRLSLLLQKPELHEDVNPHRVGSLAKEESVSPEEAMKWGESFDSLLSHKEGLNAFTKFLKTEFSEENIEFWIACEEFKKIKDAKQMVLKAKAIYQRFVKNNAPKEVNLDFHTKEVIGKSIAQPTPHCFDVGQTTVYRLMEQDSYTRFLRSDIYLDVLKGSPPQTTNLRRRSRSFTFNEFQDVKSDFAIWL
ncbi:regulator of G-protein signaling 18 [Ornithorhynchus anatinus]|uniref:Regulator of G protein signaling 18 n=1 Tax=Ornithorhynchus anatinus TaxID=9258 RepID=F6ZHJ5_ORNAN|nr:regulator of G-protein signaling 18 [Ornithorhynchus anatinus]